jgi:hypothetical protein
MTQIGQPSTQTGTLQLQDGSNDLSKAEADGVGRLA